MRFLAIALIFSIISCGQSSDAVDCGDGSAHDSGELGAICAYIVIIGGFECPAGLPHRMNFGEGAVCSERAGQPEDLPAELCEQFMVEGCTAGLPDGGRPIIDGEVPGECSDDEDCASGFCYGEADSTGGFLPKRCMNECIGVFDRSVYCTNDAQCCTGTCCLGCGEREGLCLGTESCMALDERFGVERASLADDLRECTQASDCVLSEPSLSCSNPMVQLSGCPVAVRSDQATEYQNRVAALSTSICVPGTLDCIAGPSCAPMEAACVMDQCTAVAIDPCRGATTEQACRDLGGSCTPHVGQNITGDMAGTACWDPSLMGERRFIECLNVPNPPPPVSIEAIDPASGDCYEFGLAILPTGWERCEGNMPMCS